MEECELCGEPMQSVYGVNIDGVELRVCVSCAKGKRVIYKEEERRKGRAKAHPKAVSPKKKETELVDDYGSRVRKAREAMKLPTKVLAELINEKESLLIRVEAQRTLPDPRLTRKLEKALGIKLEQEAEEVSHLRDGSRKEDATLGEFAE